VLLLVRALAGWLFRNPQFEILWAIVVPDAVLVMYLLGSKQSATEDALHDEPVLKHHLAARDIFLDVSPRMSLNAAPPSMVKGTRSTTLRVAQVI
jgi:hypothetical protein